MSGTDSLTPAAGSVEADVYAAVKQYVDGCVAADAAVVADAFSADAVMWGYLGDEYATMSGADFAANVVAAADPAGPEYGFSIRVVSVTGNTAHAVLEEQQFLGADFVNNFGLVKRDGRWRIVSKVFQTV